MTKGERAAIRRTATPDAIQFSVASVSVGDANARTTRRKPTNLERIRPIRNEARLVAAPARRGQIEITQINGTKDVTVRISAERTTSSRCTTTVRQLRERAVTIRPKVLTCGPAAPLWVTASLRATLRM